MNLMDRQQKEILAKVVQYRGGLIPQVVFHNMTGGDGKSANALIASRYIDEVSVYVDGKTYTAYRASEKGYMLFDPFPKRLWCAVKGDIRTIIITIITAIATVILTTLITNVIG